MHLVLLITVFLINKLNRNFGFSISACKHISTYFFNRTQAVKYKNVCSNYKNIEFGVPQGSLLGPFLFSVFINDLPNCTRFVRNSFFADDFQMFHSCPFSNVDSCISEINSDLIEVVNWSKLNKLEIHPTKSQVIYFSSKKLGNFSGRLVIENVPIEFFDKVKCLGIWIDKHLTWECHITSIIKRVNYTIRNLYHLNVFVPCRTKILISHAVLLSHINFGLEIFSGCSLGLLNRLKICFNNILRYIFKISRYEHISQFATLFIGTSFVNYINIRCLSFFI